MRIKCLCTCACVCVCVRVWEYAHLGWQSSALTVAKLLAGFSFIFPFFFVVLSVSLSLSVTHTQAQKHIHSDTITFFRSLRFWPFLFLFVSSPHPGPLGCLSPSQCAYTGHALVPRDPLVFSLRFTLEVKWTAAKTIYEKQNSILLFYLRADRLVLTHLTCQRACCGDAVVGLWSKKKQRFWRTDVSTLMDPSMHRNSPSSDAVFSRNPYHYTQPPLLLSSL